MNSSIIFSIKSYTKSTHSTYICICTKTLSSKLARLSDRYGYCQDDIITLTSQAYLHPQCYTGLDSTLSYGGDQAPTIYIVCFGSFSTHKTLLPVSHFLEILIGTPPIYYTTTQLVSDICLQTLEFPCLLGDTWVLRQQLLQFRHTTVGIGIRLANTQQGLFYNMYVHLFLQSTLDIST